MISTPGRMKYTLIYLAIKQQKEKKHVLCYGQSVILSI